MYHMLYNIKKKDWQSWWSRQALRGEFYLYEVKKKENCIQSERAARTILCNVHEATWLKQKRGGNKPCVRNCGLFDPL